MKMIKKDIRNKEDNNCGSNKIHDNYSKFQKL